MFSHPHFRTFCLLLPTLALGCAQGVRENRSIHWSSDGRQVVFQHGREGVFVAEGEGAPKKIFQPGPEVTATSPPLWSPTDRRLIFTSGKPAPGAVSVKVTPREPDPAGDLHYLGPTIYTCWLRPAPQGDVEPTPVALFEAECNHPGYVAAGLAVRWHPDGKQVLFIRQQGGGHALFAYDLEKKTSRQVFPFGGEDLVFDWSTDGKMLACVVGSIDNQGPNNGIWVGAPGGEKWWHVPNSGDLVTPNQPPAVLEAVRAALPVWSPDGKTFAFCTSRTDPADQTKVFHAIHLARPAEQEVMEVAQERERFRDLRWRPDGRMLGAVCGEEKGRLVSLVVGKKGVQPLGPEVLSFLGWDAKGEQMAWVASEPIPGSAGRWAFLFVPEPLARQGLFVGKEGEAEKRVLSGMQITFPHWSPADAKLSLWATFRPAWRSWPSLLVEMGATPDDPLNGLRLRSGDPALLLDPATGKLSWKAVGREQEQVGHYHLLRKEYAEAWKCYQEAEKQPPPAGLPTRLDTGLFRFHCLTKLGRQEEADKELRQVDDHFRALVAGWKGRRQGNPGAQAAFGAADWDPSDEQLRHWRNLCVAEMFLSLDAVEDGEAFFQRTLRAAEQDAERLSRSLILTQFLLLGGKHAEYADLAGRTVLPLLLKSWKARVGGSPPAQGTNTLLAYGDGLSLVPLADPRFLAGLTEGQVRDLRFRWVMARDLADDDVKRLVVDLLLEAGLRRLGQDGLADTVGKRIAANPERGLIGNMAAEGAPGHTRIEGFVGGLRQAPEQVAAMRRFLELLR
jgi:hypothetical protein